MVFESSDNEDDRETASEISDQESENPDLEPEGNSDEEETATSEILLKVKLQRRERLRKSNSQMP